MRDSFDKFKNLDTDILVLSFSEVDRLAAYKEYLKLPFEIASDSERKVYKVFGLITGSFFQIWNYKIFWEYILLLLKGRKLKMPQKNDDLYQLGGDFIIGKNGKIIFSHLSQGPEDRPSVDALLSALKK